MSTETRSPQSVLRLLYQLGEFAEHVTAYERDGAVNVYTADSASLTDFCLRGAIEQLRDAGLLTLVTSYPVWPTVYRVTDIAGPDDL